MYWSREFNSFRGAQGYAAAFAKVGHGVLARLGGLLIFESKVPGLFTTQVAVEADAAVDIDVTGPVITVQYVDGVTTLAELVDAVNGDTAASALVQCFYNEAYSTPNAVLGSLDDDAAAALLSTFAYGDLMVLPVDHIRDGRDRFLLNFEIS